MNKEKNQFEIISDKLDVLIALMFLSSLKENSLAENIKFLSRFNPSNQEIAKILGATKGTVEVTKSRINRKK